MRCLFKVVGAAVEWVSRMVVMQVLMPPVAFGRVAVDAARLAVDVVRDELGGDVWPELGGDGAETELAAAVAVRDDSQPNVDAVAEAIWHANCEHHNLGYIWEREVDPVKRHYRLLAKAAIDAGVV